MDEAKDDITNAAPGAKVYVITNNGFFEGRQNNLALEMMKNFCIYAGLVWGQGLLKRLGLALDALAENILGGKTAEDFIFQPPIPRFLYKAAAHMGWRMEAKKMG